MAYKFTPEAQKLLLDNYQETGNRVAACEAIDITLRTLERKLAADPDFRARFEHAKGLYVRSLEAEARRRAVDGVTQTKPGPGGTFYDVTTYSDTLLLHLLKKADPDRHGDKATIDVNHKHSGKIGLEKLSAEGRERLRLVLEEGAIDAEAS